MLRRLVLLGFGFGVLLGTRARCEDRAPVPPKDAAGETEDELRAEQQLRDKQRQLEANALDAKLAAEERQREEEKAAGAYLARQHLEFGMGFLGGVRDEGRSGFVFAGGSASGVPGARG